MLHAMAAFTGMQGTSDQQLQQHNQPGEQDQSHRTNDQHGGWYTQEQQLVQRRLVMHEEYTLAGGLGFELIQEALNHVDMLAQQHIADVEHRLEVFMNSTCGTVADTEKRLQERLELALRASHTDVVMAATGAARGIRDHIGSLDKRVGQINLQLEATVERYGAQLRASQESNESTHREACRAELNEAIENSRQWFEDVVISRTESKIAKAQEDLQYQIDATRNDALDRICEAEARMQEKLDEAATSSAESCEAFAKMVDNTSRGFQHLLETKIQAQGELHVAARDDTLDRICQLEARM